ncbi:MAG: DUF2950 family protein [bacterium]
MIRPASVAPLRLVLAALSLATLAACAAKSPTVAAPTTPQGQTHFATPRALVEALINACRSGDTATLVAAVGQANAALVQSGDVAADRAQCERFVASTALMTRLDPAGPDRVVLITGTDEYPMPVPLVKDAQGWHLDTAAGVIEILHRIVGNNELRAIATCRAAARGAALPASASGYAYRALGGPAATLVASPLEYRRSGVMTFLVAKNGTVYEKDLGADTVQLAAAIKGSKPDATWSVVAN